MKIAVLFSGRINRFQEHYDNIMTNIVQNNDADFFLSHSPECDEDIHKFCTIYHPKTVNNNTITYMDLSSYTCHPQSNSHNVMCMWVNRQRVFQDMRDYMVKNNIWYDIIISTRLDTWCYETLNLSKYDNLSDTDIYIPNGCDWGGLNDQLAFGNYYAMEKYMMLYSNMNPILDILMNSIGYYGPEPILKVNIELNNLIVHRFPLNYKLINGKMYHKP
jgi:hypothetical protein